MNSKQVFVVTMIGLAGAAAHADSSICNTYGGWTYCSDGSVGYNTGATYNSDGSTSYNGGAIFYSDGNVGYDTGGGVQFNSDGTTCYGAGTTRFCN